VADVSPRTFFNYFASKEEALLGDVPTPPADEVVEAFVAADGPVLDDLARVLIETGEKSMKDIEMVQLRHRLLKQYPQLFAMRMAAMREFEEQIGAIVDRRLARGDSVVTPKAGQVSPQARLVTLVAFAAMRHAWTNWASGESNSNLSDRLTESFAELKQLFASDTA
jgi:AcrR family transcriptional regulator